MAQWITCGTINTTQKNTLRVQLTPEYVAKGEYSYDNLMKLYEVLGTFLENQPTYTGKDGNEYPESLGLVVKDVVQELDKSLAAGRIKTQEAYDQIKNRRRFEKYQIELVIDD